MPDSMCAQKETKGPETASNKEYHRDGQMVQERAAGGRMTLANKLMLGASLWGVEAGCNYEHIYTAPLLQTLGMPLRFVFLTGMVAGPTAIALLPCMGWVMDRGSNPRRRKSIAIMFSFAIMLIGMLCLVTASLLHLSHLLTIKAALDVSTDLSPWINGSLSGGVNATAYMYNTSTSTATTSTEVPFKAGLAMLGFILVDLGFDGSNACVKAFMLANSPRPEHTSLLTIGLIMASAGGVSTAALGVVDFASVLGLSHIDGGHLTIQTSVQGAIVIVFIVSCVCISVVTGNRLKSSENQAYDNDTFTENVCSQTTNSNQHHSKPLTSSTSEKSIKSNRTSGLVSLDNQNRTFENNTNHFWEPYGQNVSSENTPLLSRSTEDFVLLGLGKVKESSRMATSVSQNGTAWERKTLQDLNDDTQGKGASTELMATGAIDMQKRHEPGSKWSIKTRIALIAISIYFCTGQINMFTMTTSDFVGKVIYGGDPEAGPQSESLERYQVGVRVASQGFLVYYGSYLVISTMHTHLLKCLGFRVEFVLATMLMGGASMALALTARLEFYFVLTVFAGFQRACFYVVPFAVVNDITQEMAQSTGKSKVGLAMTLVSASIPLGYCSLFSWLGAVEDYTGDVSIPLWLGVVFGCAASMSFLALGKV